MELKRFILESFSNYKFKLVKINEPSKNFLNFVKKQKIKESLFINSLKGIDANELGNFIFLLRVLDFMLWKYPENWEFKNRKGFYGLLERVKVLFKNDYKNIKFNEFKKIISPKEDLNLAKLRYRLFKKSIKWLKENFEGDFTNYFEEYNSPYDFSLKIITLEKFSDYNKNFYFLKPNQLLYYEFILAKFSSKNEKLEELTVFADHKLSQIFINFNILKIPQNYNDRIKTRKIFKNKSIFENEIRIASIIIGEILSERLKIPSYIVDNLLWHIPEKFLKLPPIRVKTIFY